uniref:Uncharacterized protein n=1 Tax=Avena sativa TaxID=4498 RepID=A0ACD5VW06_AVESA
MAGDNQFLLWLLLLSSSSLCFGSELDVQCLKSIQQSAIDPNGILGSYWNFTNDGSSNDYICGFTGVECWSSFGRILTLDMRDFGLQGPFPRGLQDCTGIINLDLSGNSFSGPIPADIGLQMPYLTSLDISNNSFSGEIPESIGNMVYLNSLSVADNLLSGPVPASLQTFLASGFAGNKALCGSPLAECSASRKRTGISLQRRINDQSSIGAAVGFVAGFVVAFYCPHWFIFSERIRAYFFRI